MDGLSLTPGGQAWTPWGLSTGYNFSEEMFLASNTTPGSVAWPVANQAMYFPFYVQAPGYYQNLWWVNGATATGNVEMGVYDEVGNLLSQTGTVAATGTSAPQLVAMPAPSQGQPGVLITPGRYFIALWASSASQTFIAWTTAAASTNVNRLLGIGQQVSLTLGLPTLATFASSANSYIPLIGLNYTTLSI